MRLRTGKLIWCLLTLTWFLWDVKEPTPLFEKSRGRRPRCCGQPTHITSFTSWAGWVQYAHKWTESGCQLCLCMLTSKLTVHLLKYIVRGHVCCPLIHDSSFIHSNICSPLHIARFILAPPKCQILVQDPFLHIISWSGTLSILGYKWNLNKSLCIEWGQT